jgi:hypothetical protein
MFVNNPTHGLAPDAYMHGAVTLRFQINHYKRMHREQCTQRESTMQASSLTYFVYQRVLVEQVIDALS